MLTLSDVLLRLAMAMIMGGAIGVERETHELAAGLRTMILVSLGACLFQIISVIGFKDFLSLPHTQLDPSRVAAYIVAGIGFLGAGSIFRSQDQSHLRGITTAATIWVVAAIGLACGCGLILEAAVATVLTLVVLICLRLFERFFSPRKSERNCIFSIKADTSSLLSTLYETCSRFNATVVTIEVAHKSDSDAITLLCRGYESAIWPHVADALRGIPGVQDVRMDLQSVTPKMNHDWH
jgi:putative Mg2+ transporter-C (MgtC) family protein